jgi:hypothetical protein
MTVTPSTQSPVRTSIVVHAPIQSAFDTFTAGIGSWWPSAHHVLQAELAEMVFEPRPVNLDWQIETDPERTSEVEVRFISEGADRTRVELEHRGLERHGDGWERMRGAVASPEGWPAGLAAFGQRLGS